MDDFDFDFESNLDKDRNLLADKPAVRRGGGLALGGPPIASDR